MFTEYMSAGGGTRTHTRANPKRILSPLRLPIPPLRQMDDQIQYERRRSDSNRRIAVLQTAPLDRLGTSPCFSSKEM